MSLSDNNQCKKQNGSRLQQQRKLKPDVGAAYFTLKSIITHFYSSSFEAHTGMQVGRNYKPRLFIQCSSCGVDLGQPQPFPTANLTVSYLEGGMA
ncbi:hypothetical protein BV898_02730 [Hypsibius exemplaris]|uniref:Uncharacterized protein n=1 Tax=Hypsibius exemplaris TaxID=2072580 RepID=A0A1W0X6W4_HYPEX|nr:hypothetical protein BV898_02730 [Hypsibius exemplaris]